jgi:NAD-dependent DNA ligase
MTNEQIKELISRRRRQILIHSCIYYRLNSNIWTDTEYDEKAKELQQLQEKHPDIAAECPYHNEFKNFTETSSGFDLQIHDPDLVRKAQRLLKYHQERKG